MNCALIRLAAPADYRGLVALYEAFEPKEQFQGLPPARLPQIRAWLKAHFTPADHHLVAVVGERIVGHAMLCCGPAASEAELAIFMHQDFQGLGIGKQLLLATLYRGCKELALARVWLSVQGSNPRALHVFESVGFCAREPEALAWELEMTRVSHCAQCRGKRCQLYGHATPLTVSFRRRRAARACAVSR